MKIESRDEYREIIPPLLEKDYSALKDSIEEYGQYQPIILNKKGWILDGHNRFKACQELGKNPIIMIKEFPNESHEKLFVIQSNLTRRHLNDYQRVELALKTKPILEEIAKNNTTANLPTAKNQSSSKCLELGGKGVIERVGRIANVSHEQVRRVEKITLRGTDDQKQKLRTGTKSINEIYKGIEKEEKRQKILKSKPEINLPEDCNLYLGDLVEESKNISDCSIDLIFTDPPYGDKNIDVYTKLGQLAQRVLKNGGSLVTFIGTYNLPKFLTILLDCGLKYWWILCVKHTGQHGQMFQRKVFINWKPLIWFVKGDKIVEGLESVNDYIQSEPAKKILHEWEQSTVEAEHVINKLTVPNQIVLDPLMGSGTVGVAALKLKRKFIGIELDKEFYEIARNRLG